MPKIKNKVFDDYKQKALKLWFATLSGHREFTSSKQILAKRKMKRLNSFPKVGFHELRFSKFLFKAEERILFPLHLLEMIHFHKKII